MNEHENKNYPHNHNIRYTKTEEKQHTTTSSAALSLLSLSCLLTFSRSFFVSHCLGVVEPEEIEHARIMDIGKTYLGKLHGQYTDWTPLVRRNLLFPENIDEKDPWQFQNFRVQ